MQVSKYYAGIGSRKTPKHICEKMTAIAQELSRLGYCCNSGGAQRADEAFERGAEKKQIFLPWDGFNGKRIGDDYIVPLFCERLVYKYHPRPSALSNAGWNFMSRNSYQVLGKDLKTPVSFVLCWTSDGKASGGTGQAIRIAEDHSIPVFNFYYGFDAFANYMISSSFFG